MYEYTREFGSWRRQGIQGDWIVLKVITRRDYESVLVNL